MLKRIFFLLLLISGNQVMQAQFTYKIKADSVKITNDSCTAELILENQTKAVKGYLYNKGNGRTEFRKALTKVNDTTYLIGGDTLTIRESSNNWKTTGNAGISGATRFIGTTDGNAFSIRTNNLDRIRVTNSGNVGIGTTLPAQKLHLYGQNPSILLEGDENSYYPAIFFKSLLGNAKIDNYGPGGQTGAYITTWTVNNKTVATGVTSEGAVAVTADSIKRAFRIIGAQNQVADLFHVSQNNHTLPGAVFEQKVFSITKDGRVGISGFTPTAMLHIKPGTSTANTAPLKLTAGTNLTTPEDGAVEYDGTNYYATSGTTRYTLAKTLTTTSTLDFGNTSAQSSSDLTVTLTGAVVGDAVSLGVPMSARSANSSFEAWVSAANTVTVRFNNYSAGSIDPGGGGFRVVVVRY